MLLAGSWVTYDCSIRDVSETGARIRLASESVILPKEFELMFVADDISYPVLMRWQRNAEYGVEFSGPARKITSRVR